jgi:hypothetical protein
MPPETKCIVLVLIYKYSVSYDKMFVIYQNIIYELLFDNHCLKYADRYCGSSFK